MKKIEEIKDELKKQKHELAKHQHMIDMVAKTDHDKFIAKIKTNKTHHIINALEWVLSES